MGEAAMTLTLVEGICGELLVTEAPPVPLIKGLNPTTASEVLDLDMVEFGSGQRFSGAWPVL